MPVLCKPRPAARITIAALRALDPCLERAFRFLETKERFLSRCHVSYFVDITEIRALQHESQISLLNAGSGYSLFRSLPTRTYLGESISGMVRSLGVPGDSRPGNMPVCSEAAGTAELNEGTLAPSP